MKPLITVIVPVYNVERHLPACFDSIRAQTFTDLEVIAVNDGSTDRSGAICEAYAKKDKRIKAVHKSHGGVSSSRNTGVSMASGEYIGFVDGDDYIDEAMYQTLYQLCEKTKSDIGICRLGREIDGKLITNKEKEITVKEMDNSAAMKELFTGKLYRFSLCNKLFRKSCFLNLEFPFGRIHEDLATTYRLFAQANKAVFTNEIGYFYVRREKSILTTSFNEKRLDAFIAWDEIIGFMGERYSQMQQEVYASFGYWGVDNIHYILNQVKNHKEAKKYLSAIQVTIRQHYKKLMKNRNLPLKHKLTLGLLHYNIYFLLLSVRMKKTLYKFNSLN